MTVRFAFAFILLTACAAASDPVAHEKAIELWRRNMVIVDESVAFWKGRTGRSPHTQEELTDAIDFFQTLTNIRGTNMSFIGPIPDESLEMASRNWKAWYATHGEALTYDESKKRVILPRYTPRP
jgi:hypothetical protein